MHEIAICDDDGAFAAGLQAMITEIMREQGADCHISRYADPAQLWAAIEGGAEYHLIFQDILFGAEKGIRFARQLREKKKEVELVFVTSSADYAIASFDVFPLHYLLKPVTRERLEKVLERFLEQFTPRMLCLSTARGLMRFPIRDVLYFEIYSHTIVIHLCDGSSKSLTGTLKELEQDLPPHCFVRTHRSYLVNLEHISEVDRNQVLLTQGQRVPVSKSSYARVQLSLVEYDERKMLTD